MPLQRLVAALLVFGAAMAASPAHAQGAQVAKSPAAPAQGGAAPATPPPPPEVAVVAVTLGEVPLIAELPGRTESSRIAQVRARSAGILQRRLFREGSDVRAGQPLFQIDDAPYRATLASAQASLARAEASLISARAAAERNKPLVEANAISQQEYVASIATLRQVEAEVAAGKAAVQAAQINLDYTAVNAPIAGRIGRALVTEGALVGQGEATQLALIQQIDPLFVNFTQPVGEVMRMRKAIEQGQLQRSSGPTAAVVRLVLEDGSVYPLPGKLLFSDLTVDPNTAQISLRAEVPNPKAVLLPGLFVRVRIEQARAQSAVLLPQQAVTSNAQGSSVLVVGPEGKVAPRPVKLGQAQAGQWVVLDGLKVGEQVIVEGFQKLRPNQPVKTVPWKGPGVAANPGAGSSPGAGPAAGNAPAPGGAPAAGKAPAAR